MARPTATSPACSRRSPAPRSSGSPSRFPGGIAGKGARTARLRWRNRAIAVFVGPLLVYPGLYPTAAAIVPTHKSREPIPAPPSGYETVTFDSSDGLELSGWYAPSRNRAVIVLVHGGGGDRTGPLDHA